MGKIDLPEEVIRHYNGSNNYCTVIGSCSAVLYVIKSDEYLNNDIFLDNSILFCATINGLF